MARTGLRAYLHTMENPAEIGQRWRYLRDLLIDQLAGFEAGDLQMHTAGVDVGGETIARLKQNILEFDALIAQSAPKPDQIGSYQSPGKGS